MKEIYKTDFDSDVINVSENYVELYDSIKNDFDIESFHTVLRSIMDSNKKEKRDKNIHIISKVSRLF